MKVRISKTMLAACVLGFAMHSQAVTVTFDSQKTSLSNAAVGDGTRYTESGFTFTSNTLNGLRTWGAQTGFNADPTGATLFQNYGGSSITITQANGHEFSLASLDLAYLYNSAVVISYEYGYSGAAGSYNGFLTTPSTRGLLTFNLGLNHLDSFFIKASPTFFQIDNVVLADALAPVPEPETYGMMVAGLSVMGLLARRRRKPV